MNGKNVLKTVGAVLAGIAAGVTVAAAKKEEGTSSSGACSDYATYGMAINAITKSDMTGFWKNSCIQEIPKDCKDPGLYAAVISIMEGDMTDFWKHSAIQELFS